jgi:PQQ-dependent dehydrogenase (methanol/ethanol family)
VSFYLAVAGGGGGVPTNRGVTVANGKVYIITFDDRLIALQAATGEMLWQTAVANANVGYSETSPPTYWHGMLFVGSAEGDAGERGFVAAFDAQTGKQLWRFYTVPAPGHGWMPGSGFHGGGDVWMPPTIDTTDGMLYFGTGNPSPDEMTSIRPGCNPWTDAVVALDARTGTFKWGHTQVCADAWDYDSHQATMLFYVHHNGKIIRAVGQGNKEGYYWIFDAKTGQVLAKSPALSRQTLPRPLPTAKGVVVCPGSAGGIEYSPAAYSPLTNAIYQQSLNLCQIYQLATAREVATHPQGAVDVGGDIANGPGPYDGAMSAIDPNTGKLLWQDHVSGNMIGGSLATGGNLVFAGCDNGHFYAFDATTGRILWQPNLGLGFGANPITYAVNGTQYVAVAVGGSDIALSNGANLGGTMVVFKLGGAPVTPQPIVNTGGVLVPMNQQLPSLHGMTQVNQWTYVNVAKRHVIFKLVAAATATNSGFNFDGYAKGQANFVVLVGWNVDFLFSNAGGFPHSAAIASNLKPPVNLPYFGFAPVSTPNPTVGIGPHITQVMSMNALPDGNFYIVCLVPGHIQTGMWDHFTISTTATMPAILTTS